MMIRTQSPYLFNKNFDRTVHSTVFYVQFFHEIHDRSGRNLPLLENFWALLLPLIIFIHLVLFMGTYIHQIFFSTMNIVFLLIFPVVFISATFILLVIRHPSFFVSTIGVLLLIFKGGGKFADPG
jgi:hypothetical protein